MDRPLIYPVEVPAVEDLLWGWQRAMVSVAKLASAILGPSPDGAWVDDFTATPIGGLSIDVNPGQIYQLAPVDPNGYSVLHADPTIILRQFINEQYTQFTLTAPTTSGTSQYYLIQLTPETVDTGNQILQYFDVANPGVAFGGPNNSGAAQATERVDTVVVQLVAGTPAATGSEVPPPLSGAAVGGWYVLLTYGQNTISASNITPVAAAPFLNLKLPYAAGTQISNTFTQSQTIQGSLGVGGTVTAAGEQINGNSNVTGNQTVGGNEQINGNAIVSGTISSSGSIPFRSTGYETTGLTIGWNFTDYTGEVDFLLGPQGGSGGLNIYQLNSSGAMVSTTPIAALSGNGSLTLQGGLSVAGTTTLNTTTVPNATASANPVPLGQLNSLIPVLFSSFNNVTGSRVFGTTYTNSTGKPMLVAIEASFGTGGANVGWTMYINGAVAGGAGLSGSGGSHTSTVSVMVPSGATYEAAWFGATGTFNWTETY